MTGNHENNQLPVALLGRGGGQIRIGRVLDYTGRPNRKVCSLYLSLLDKAGVHLDRFGDSNQRLAEIRRLFSIARNLEPAHQFRRLRNSAWSRCSFDLALAACGDLAGVAGPGCPPTLPPAVSRLPERRRGLLPLPSLRIRDADCVTWGDRRTLQDISEATSRSGSLFGTNRGRLKTILNDPESATIERHHHERPTQAQLLREAAAVLRNAPAHASPDHRDRRLARRRCRVYRGGYCNCNPEIKLRPKPERS